MFPTKRLYKYIHNTPTKAMYKAFMNIRINKYEYTYINIPSHVYDLCEYTYNLYYGLQILDTYYASKVVIHIIRNIVYGTKELTPVVKHKNI